MIRNCLLAVLILCGFSQSLAAQTSFPPKHRRWEFSVIGGGSFIGEGQHATPVSGPGTEGVRSVGLRYDKGYVLGIRLAENFREHLGAEFEYSFSNQPVRLSNLSPGLPLLSMGHTVHRFVYDVMYYPLDKSSRLRPYAFIGAGTTLFHVDASSKADVFPLGIELKDRWKFTFSWGGGVKYLLADQTVMRLDFSDRVSGVSDFGFPSAGGNVQGRFVPGFRPAGHIKNWTLTLGLAYQFGEW